MSTAQILHHTNPYNELPSLEEAVKQFRPKRAEVMPRLKSLFGKPQYRDKYGFCLVHRHCELFEGEKMVEVEHNPLRMVSRPVIANDFKYYPERWLSNGLPFEFTLQETNYSEPPVELSEEFRQIVESVSLHVLGIFLAPIAPRPDGVYVETTKGRENITEWKDHPFTPEMDKQCIETGWLIQGDDPTVVAACTKCSVSGNVHYQISCC